MNSEVDVEGARTAVKEARAGMMSCSREAQPRQWAILRREYADALVKLGLATYDDDVLSDAVVAAASAVDVLDSHVDPLEWARAQHTVGVGCSVRGDLRRDLALVEQGLVAFFACWSVYRHTHTELLSAVESVIERNMQILLVDTDNLRPPLEGIGATVWKRYQARRRERGPVPAAFGDASVDISTLRQTAEREQERAAQCSRDDRPQEWARLQCNYAISRMAVGMAMQDTQQLREAIKVFSDILLEIDHTEDPDTWTRAQGAMGYIYLVLGKVCRDHTFTECGLGALIECWYIAQTSSWEGKVKMLPKVTAAIERAVDDLGIDVGAKSLPSDMMSRRAWAAYRSKCLQSS